MSPFGARYRQSFRKLVSRVGGFQAEQTALSEALRNAEKETTDAAETIRDLRVELLRSAMRHRPAPQLLGEPDRSTTEIFPVDADLVARIIASYKLANQTDFGSPESMWFTELAAPKKSVHDALVLGDVEEVTSILRDPSKSALFFGFENTYSATLPRDRSLEDFWGFEASYDTLRRLGEAVGVFRVENAESFFYGTRIVPVSSDHILDILDNHFGFRISFPNPYADEYGLKTSRGVATYRAIQGIFQAKRIAELLKGRHKTKIVEIGGGLGRTAYYANQFGFDDYLLIDLPLTSAAQAYFLGRTLGQERICLFGETGPGIKIMPPTAFLDNNDRYDLAVNVDSFTEMASETAREYCQAIKARADLFLSINHEGNPFTVGELCLALDFPASFRNPYWLRRGYVEETFQIVHSRRV